MFNTQSIIDPRNNCALLSSGHSTSQKNIKGGKSESMSVKINDATSGKAQLSRNKYDDLIKFIKKQLPEDVAKEIIFPYDFANRAVTNMGSR